MVESKLPDNPLQVGIGHIIEPLGFKDVIGSRFAMHDHHYVAPQVPDPNRACVTYTFDKPTEISEVKIIQHANGITKYRRIYRRKLRICLSVMLQVALFRWVLLGVMSMEMPMDLVKFQETSPDIFKFDHAATGKVFRFIIRKTSLANGYALYRAYPLNSLHEPYVPSSK